MTERVPDCDWCDDAEVLDDGEDGLTCPKCWHDLRRVDPVPDTPEEYIAAVRDSAALGEAHHQKGETDNG